MRTRIIGLCLVAACLAMGCPLIKSIPAPTPVPTQTATPTGSCSYTGCGNGGCTFPTTQADCIAAGAAFQPQPCTTVWVVGGTCK